jgi:cobalamin synthase
VTGLMPLLAFPLAQGVAALLVAGAASALLLAKAARSIGGQTGDVLGASLQVFEAAVLLVLAGNWA